MNNHYHPGNVRRRLVFDNGDEDQRPIDPNEELVRVQHEMAGRYGFDFAAGRPLNQEDPGPYNQENSVRIEVEDARLNAELEDNQQAGSAAEAGDEDGQGADPAAEAEDEDAQVADPAAEAEDKNAQVADPAAEAKHEDAQVADPAAEAEDEGGQVADPAAEAEDEGGEVAGPAVEAEDKDGQVADPAAETEDKQDQLLSSSNVEDEDDRDAVEDPL